MREREVGRKDGRKGRREEGGGQEEGKKIYRKYELGVNKLNFPSYIIKV